MPPIPISELYSTYILFMNIPSDDCDRGSGAKKKSKPLVRQGPSRENAMLKNPLTLTASVIVAKLSVIEILANIGGIMTVPHNGDGS